MTRHAPNRRRIATTLLPINILLVGVIAVAGSGCKSPAARRTEADRVAADIIHQKQLEALGRSEPHQVEPAGLPSERLRRRLILEHGLPLGNPASLGSEHLPQIRHLPRDVQTGVPVPEEAERAVLLEDAESVPPLRLTLLEALQVGARNSRSYQTRKENVFIEALRLDLERNFFRTTFTGIVSGQVISDLGPPGDTTGVVVSPQVGFTQRLQNGVVLTGRVAIDIVKLLSGGRDSSFGIFADTSISMPLLRGSGRHIVAEPLTQAERNVVYAIWEFETFKRNFAVDIAREYLTVLQGSQQVSNAEENYRRLITSTRRALRLAQAGRLDAIQVDQAIQQELRARERWISSRENYFRRIDSFKMLLGLPPDAPLELDETELERLAVVSERILLDMQTEDQPPTPHEEPLELPPLDLQPAQPQPPEQIDDALPADAPVELTPPGVGTLGPLELYPEDAVRIAFANRLDLRVTEGQLFDAQRRVVVAADALGPGLNVVGNASWGGRRASLGAARLPDAQLRLDEGLYSLGATLDLPLERTSERNAYRISLINLERAVRAYQESEDNIKFAVRSTLGSLLQARESLQIQAQALVVAQRRVASTELFLEAGRALMRDVLEAQEALITAQNAFTAALITYRINELQLQRDLGVLEVSHEGLWREYTPELPPDETVEEPIG
jgi:outer membrane protein TolC